MLSDSEQCTKLTKEANELSKDHSAQKKDSKFHELGNKLQPLSKNSNYITTEQTVEPFCLAGNQL